MMAHLDSDPVLAVPRATSFFPALPLCMCPLKFWRNGFIQVSPILFMPFAFHCGFFSLRHFTEVASIIAPVLGRRILPRAARKPDGRLMEVQRTSGLCWMLSHRDLCSVTFIFCILPTAWFLRDHMLQ